jgi:K+-sensing histidine kinase KdpD
MRSGRANGWGAAAGYAGALVGPSALTALLNALPQAQSRDYVFLYIGLVAVLGVASGLGPAVVAAAASFLLVDYFFALPLHTLTIASETDLVNLVVFFGAAGLVGSLGSRRRAAQLRAEQLADRLRAANIELERLNKEQAEAAAMAVRLAQTQHQVQMLQETDRLRSELLANVSHELRTPLGSILTGSTDLLTDPELTPRARDEIGSVVQETERLDRLVSDMLDMARIEGHAIALSAAEVDLRDAIDSAVGRLRRTAPSRTVEVRLPEGDMEVIADWTRLGQILDNLLSNADRYAPGNTPIRVEASPGKRSMVVIRVIDAGPGIPADQRERIFERFVRSPDSAVGHSSEAEGGTGLGLAIVRGLVEAHAGRVWLEDPEPGEGGRFAFTLPAA